MLSRFSRVRRALLASLGAGVLLMSPVHPAHAYGFVRFGFGFPYGFGFGFPFFAPIYPFYGPRVIVAPAPVVYSAPPVVYVQPQPSAAAASARCYAAAYVCPIRRPLVAGTPCSCPTNTGRVVGEVG